ncbi:MAG: histidine phosphatase family protein [Pseudomonadota bacterium]
MKRLILIRHAKSSWDNPHDDHARTLNDRGRRACKALGAWLDQKRYRPGQVISSDAARTRETTSLIFNGMEPKPHVTLTGTLYHASPDALLAALRTATSDTVALVAHNPGIAFFAEGILREPPNHPRFFDYPTGATLVCDFDIEEWAGASPASAHLVDFIVPRELTDQ